MKQAILATLILMVAGQLSAQTTSEEYNYVTRGYKIQVESGLDMKKGYELVDVDHVPQKSANGAIVREAWLKVLNRVSATGARTIAAYMIIYQKAGGDKQYFCVVSPNSAQPEVDAFFVSLGPGAFEGSEKLQLIAYMLSRSIKWQ